MRALQTNQNNVNFFSNLKSKVRHPLTLVLIIFFLESLYIALRVRFGEMPDETWHILNIWQREKDLTRFFIDNSESLPILGDIETIPFLYHHLLAFLLKFNFFLSDYIYLRLLNIGISILNLIVVYKFSLEMTAKKHISAFTTFLMSQTIMFIVISAAVNYDNLVNLFCTISLFYFYKYFKNNTYPHLLTSFLFMFLALQVKFTSVPLLAVLTIVAFCKIIHTHLILKKKFEFKLNSGNLILVSLVILFGFINLNLYGRNLVKYKTFQVECNQVESEEFCDNYGAYHRNKLFAQRETNKKVELIAIPYEWGSRMYARVHGVLLAHINSVNIYDLPGILTFTFIYCSTFVLAIRKRKVFKLHELLWIPIFSFYALTILYVNYKDRQMLGEWIAVQGRYIFPVFPLIFVFIASTLTKYKYQLKKIKQLKLFSIIFCLLIILLAFGIFTLKIPSDLYTTTFKDNSLLLNLLE